MGGAVSSGRDNNELIDNLMTGGYIRTRAVERVFRVLDRADFITPSERNQAYKDLAWRNDKLHLSAPCIYSEVLEGLDLRPGLSFLNVGSGTGYLSTLVGLMLGSGGVSHGVEVYDIVVQYSTKQLTLFYENCATLDEFDFCAPKYFLGNALCLAPLQSQYDRMYVGAGVMPKYENYFKQLIKVGGLLVMPLGDTLVQVRRVSETEWTTKKLLNVSFALLMEPTKEEMAELIKLDDITPPSLMLLCRGVIRRAMHGAVCRRHPELREPAPRRPPAQASRTRRICIPMDHDMDDEPLNDLHDLGEQDGGREMNALLSLVMSMGANRDAAAGSLRVEQINDMRGGAQMDGDVRVLIEQVANERNDDTSSSSAEYSWPSEAPVVQRARPSAAGAAGAATVEWPQDGAAPEVCEAATVPLPLPEDAPRATPGETDLSALTPAGAVQCALLFEDLKPTSPDTSSDSSEASASSDDSKPSTSGVSPAAIAAGHSTPVDIRPIAPPPKRSVGCGTAGSYGSYGSGDSYDSGGSGGSGDSYGRGGGGSGDRRQRPRPPGLSSRQRAARNKRFLPENLMQMELYFGGIGVGFELAEAGAAARGAASPTTSELAEAGAAARGVASPTTSEPHSETEGPPTTTETKRQKLDSGIGEGSASTSSSQTNSPPDSEARESSHTDTSTDNQEISVAAIRARRRVRRSHNRAGSSPARRGTRDARRVRLSIVMKRAIKELPLPYLLKKYVNLHRCFEF